MKQKDEYIPSIQQFLSRSCHQEHIVYIMIVIQSFRSKSIAAFINLVKTLGTEESLKLTHKNSYIRPFHWNLLYFKELFKIGTAKYASFISILYIKSPGSSTCFNRNIFPLEVFIGDHFVQSLITGRFPYLFSLPKTADFSLPKQQLAQRFSDHLVLQICVLL